MIRCGRLARHAAPAAVVLISSLGLVFHWSDQAPGEPLTGPSLSPAPIVGVMARRETQLTLDPARFVGKAAVAYRVAREIRDVLDQIYCYCRCDKHMGHKSLLSCYTDGHAATCDVCMDEALDASRMVKAGRSIAEVKAEIDRKYGR